MSPNTKKPRKVALIVATSEYADSKFNKLLAPSQDAKALANILENDAIGGFKVKVLLNEISYKITGEIEEFFTNCEKDDLLLLYFSCHGHLDDDNHFYFITTDTILQRLHSTSIPTDFINKMMNKSKSKRQILLLDCCYSGSIAKGWRVKGGPIPINAYFENPDQGKGKFILTSSDSLEYSLEGYGLDEKGIPECSLFTNAIVEGLETGEADLGNDGYISLDDLYKYTFGNVTKKTSCQKPKKFEMDMEGKDVFIAKSELKKSEIDLQDQHILDLREAALTKLKDNQQRKIINDFQYVLRSSKYSNEAKNSTEYSDKKWSILIKDLNRQRFVPFIGPAACFFPGENEDIRFPIIDILQKWILRFKYPIEEESYTSWKNIKESGYPLDPSYSLSNVAQSISIIHDDPMYPKRLLAEEIAKMTSTDFTDKYNKTAYSFLADLNLPIYVTTNYDHFMEAALKSRGKQPISGFCKWNKELVRNNQFGKSRDHQPETSSPLVYHLFGHVDIPESLVLTKTDFNEFAYFLNKEEERRIFPNTLLIKLATSLLLFIGYNFEHMHFHNLYESMIERFDFIMQSDRTIVQPLPLFTNTELNNQLQYLNEIAKKKYKANVYWGNIFDFENDLFEYNEKFRNKDKVLS